MEHALAGDRRVVVVAQRSGIDDRPSTADALHSVGVIANVVDRQTQVDGALKVTVCGLQRTGIVRVTDGEFLAAEVKVIEEQGRQSKEAGALSGAVLNVPNLRRRRFFGASTRIQSPFQHAFGRRSEPVGRHSCRVTIGRYRAEAATLGDQ